MVISVENHKFSRFRMTKQTPPLNSSRETQLPRRILLDSKTVGISRFSRHRVSGDTWHGHVDATWHPRGMTHGMSHVVHLG